MKVYHVRPDERLLLKTLQDLTRIARLEGGHVYVREMVRGLGIDESRAVYIIEKWEGRGWYDCGVHSLAGWLEDKGMAVVVDTDCLREGDAP